MNILLVEDSKILRDRLRSLINAIPRAILVAEIDTESAARAYLAQHQPDVAVIDLRLRAGSGLPLIEWLHAHYPSTVIIVMTNYVQSEYRQRCMERGAHYFFDKSNDIETFAALLKSLSPPQTSVTH